MIEKRTVFILGAGASCPYGFPPARGLREQILSFFEDRYIEFLGGSGEEIQVERMRKGYPGLPDAGRFLECFNLSSTESIDLFLSRNPQFQKIGKIATCLSILHAEKDSSFRGQVKAECDWYFYLFNSLTREAKRKDDYCRFGDNRISFITFNYDRSLEHFLFDSLLHSFEGTDRQNVREQLAKTPVIHVYGKPAPLPWEQDDERKGIPYGFSDLAALDFLGVIDNIHVVHEERANPELEKVRIAISEAERIFFLGFGYAKENLQALGLPEVLKRRHRIYGTAMGSTPKEVHDVTHAFVDGLQHSGNEPAQVGDQVKIRDCDCVHLLREFL